MRGEAMSTINPYNGTPAYLQIADDLRRQIAQGDLQDGDQLPSVRDLIATYGTALGTVRQAVDQLKAEGLVVARQGRGVFVRKPRRLTRYGSKRLMRSTRAADSLPLQNEAESQGFARTSELNEVSSAPAPVDVASRLRVESNESVVRRIYILGLDGIPTQTAQSYFPHRIADGTLLAQQVKPPGGTHAYLADNLGLHLESAIEELVGRMPTRQEVAQLHLDPGTPVVEIIRTIYAQDGDPVEVTVFVCAADRHRFVYEVPID